MCNSSLLTLNCSKNVKTFVTPLEKQCEFLACGVLQTQIVTYPTVLNFFTMNKNELGQFKNKTFK